MVYKTKGLRNRRTLKPILRTCSHRIYLDVRSACPCPTTIPALGEGDRIESI